MSKKKNDLGKGIRALLESIENEVPAESGGKTTTLSASTAVPVHAIMNNPFQPRSEFDEEAMRELSESIRTHGIIQPLTLRRTPEGKYQLIAGERRLRAAKMAGLKEVPAFIRGANDQEMLELALIENIQREDLNAIEVAIHFQRLIEECSLTHEQLAGRIGKNRTTITNALRLLKLPPEIQKGLRQKKISMGHARALINLEDPAGQLAIYQDILKNDLSVREVETLVRNFRKRGTQKKTSGEKALPFEIRRMQDQLSSRLSTRVIIRRNTRGKGEIVIRFFSDDDLYRLNELIED